MRTLLVIGIGAGDPEYMTVQAIKALNQADVIFVVEKPGERDDLVRLRREICDRYIEGDSYRVVDLPDPERDRSAPGYRAAVEEWRQRRADVWERAIEANVSDEESGAFLVWGDPSLYDSTLAILDDILARGTVAFEHQVIPGISSVHALTARHRIALNRVGGAVEITPARLLSEGLPAGVDDVVVMLDAGASFTNIAPDGIDIYWGAYLGTEDEILISGPLAERAPDIERARREARERHGWIMDTYLLRRRR
ncbi:MAG TPA: precorrin-6A synthase (deacetylating) [Solirubrobacteraceae bacterium]